MYLHVRTDGDGRRGGGRADGGDPDECEGETAARLHTVLYHPVAVGLSSRGMPELRGDHADERRCRPRRSLHHDTFRGLHRGRRPGAELGGALAEDLYVLTVRNRRVGR